MNKIILIGRLTKEVDVRFTPNQLQIAGFTLAVNRRFAKDGQQDVDFINCKAFGKTAEFCTKYFAKGQQVAVTGRLQINVSEKDGQRTYFTEVVVEEAHFAESKGSGVKPNPSEKKEDDGFYPVNEDEDSLPF